VDADGGAHAIVSATRPRRISRRNMIVAESIDRAVDAVRVLL